MLHLIVCLGTNYTSVTPTENALQNATLTKWCRTRTMWQKMNTKSITTLVHILNLFFLQSVISNWRATKTCFNQFFNYRLASFANKHCSVLHNDTSSSKSWKHCQWLVLFPTLLMQNLWRVIWNVFFWQKKINFETFWELEK